MQEDFNSFDYSTAQNLANQLLPVRQQPDDRSSGSKATIIGAVVGVVVLLIMMVLIGILGCILYARLK